MSRPKDIPQAVWDMANDAADDWFERDDKFHRGCALHFAMTILAAKAEEREACALIADAVINRDGNMMFVQGAGWIGLRQVMSNAIRKHGEAP